MHQISLVMHAAMTNEGGRAHSRADQLRLAASATIFTVGMQVVQGPDFHDPAGNESESAGAAGPGGDGPAGAVTSVRNGRCTVRWSAAARAGGLGPEHKYRCGEGKVFEVAPSGVRIDPRPRPPAVTALAAVLDKHLTILRAGLDHPSLLLCLEVTLLSLSLTYSLYPSIDLCFYLSVCISISCLPLCL